MQRLFALDTLKSAANAFAPASLRAASGIDRILTTVPQGRTWAEVPFNSLTLSSSYQPIMAVATRSLLGYEGLLSVRNVSGQALSATTAFGMARDLNEERQLDWLARALHLRNLPVFGGGGKLFLNVFPTAANEDLHFADVFTTLLRHYGAKASDVVVEILETGVDDEARLIDAVAQYRDLGCQIALDDFGVGFSNLDRLWRLNPDIVKIDKSVMRAAGHDHNARRVLKNLVRMVHECGAAVVIEGIEERREALIALESDADYLQGFYFGRPSREPLDAAEADNVFTALMHHYENAADLSGVTGAQPIGQAGAELAHAAGRLQAQSGFGAAVDSLLDCSGVVRAYLIGQTGQQLFASVNLKRVSAAEAMTERCPCGRGWQLQNLLATTRGTPGLVHVSRPYLPLSNGEDCITMSMAFLLAGEPVVLCCDVLWGEVVSELVMAA